MKEGLETLKELLERVDKVKNEERNWRVESGCCWNVKIVDGAIGWRKGRA